MGEGDSWSCCYSKSLKMGFGGGHGGGKGVGSGLAIAEPLPKAAISTWAGLGPRLGADWGAVSSGSWASPGIECQRGGRVACRLWAVWGLLLQGGVVESYWGPWQCWEHSRGAFQPSLSNAWLSYSSWHPLKHTRSGSTQALSPGTSPLKT